MIDALVIGAGPAGLMAAEVLASAGHKVVVTEAKPSIGRKFLMAGKSGLNLTKDEPFDRFLMAYAEAAPKLRPALAAFGPPEVQAWAQGLGQDIFTGSSGRVFPKVMKASPLLRAWLRRLTDLGVEFRPGWRWIGRENGFVFAMPEGEQCLNPKVTVLACGGASWARLGSDGAWSALLPDVAMVPFQPANMGFSVAWSPFMSGHFGSPVKSVGLRAGADYVKNEFVISSKGVEGSGIYTVSRAMREGAALTIDLVPDLGLEVVRTRLAQPRGKQSLSNHLRKVLKLDPVKIALLMEFGRPLPDDLAPILKALPIVHQGPLSMDQAISTAGGISLDAVDDSLMISALPNVWAAGEMLDWEAPTGGYLITACLATGRWAGLAAARAL